ncbi:hypothetical protein ACFYZ9_33710 [Streptomyces sp. NPDC001691]|uniref:hypothetical protein n=1 Tax=Streptomyces sp. NPDC001691 TaxID=3364600 RepID=UPI0036D1A7F5
MLRLAELAPGARTAHATGRATVTVKKYGAVSGREFVRAAVRAQDGRSRAALVTLRPAAYPHAEAWLDGLARCAPATADYRNPSASPESVRLLAEMTRTHANGVPRQSDGSVGWSVPGASARVWPDGRLTVRSEGGVELSARLEGAEWDSWGVAAAADVALRLLCAPEARHITRTSEPSAWYRPLDRGHVGGGRERKGNQSYDGSSTARCSCGWRGAYPSRLAALAMAAEHRKNSVVV